MNFAELGRHVRAKRVSMCMYRNSSYFHKSLSFFINWESMKNAVSFVSSHFNS